MVHLIPFWLVTTEIKYISCICLCPNSTLTSSNQFSKALNHFRKVDNRLYTQYVLISKGPISKTSQISGFFKQWLVKFSKLSNNLFCSRFLSNPLVIFFNLSKSKLLLLHSNLLPLVFLSEYDQTFVSFFRFSLYCFNLKKVPKFYVWLFSSFHFWQVRIVFLINFFFSEN